VAMVFGVDTDAFRVGASYAGSDAVQRGTDQHRRCDQAGFSLPPLLWITDFIERRSNVQKQPRLLKRVGGIGLPNAAGA
jgi:hypothetical protein